MPVLPPNEKRKLVYPAVDLDNRRWPVALIRESLAEQGSEPGIHAGSLATRELPLGRDRFLANLGMQICAIRALDTMTAGERTPGQLRLEIGALLAACVGDTVAFERIVAEARTAGSGPQRNGAELGAWLGEELEETGKRLLNGRVSEENALFSGPFHLALLSIERRLMDRLAVDFFARALGSKRAEDHRLSAREEKVALVEAVIGLAWADGLPDKRERQWIAALIDVAGFDAGERTMLRSALDDGGVSLDRIAEDVHGRDDALRLLETLAITAFIDGEFSSAERAYIDALAGRLAITEAEATAIDFRIAERLAGDQRLRKSMSTSGRVGRTVRTRSNAVEGLVRKHVDAIGRELLQTSDLVALLAKSVRTTLTADENKRMKAQLIDVCKAVPALALFAAPGGSLLLPVLARALPFSLAPSSFKDADEAAF